MTTSTITVSGVSVLFSTTSSSLLKTGYVETAKSGNFKNTNVVPGAIKSIKLVNCGTTSTATDGSYIVYAGTEAGSIITKIADVTGLSSTKADKTTTFTGEYT